MVIDRDQLTEALRAYDDEGTVGFLEAGYPAIVATFDALRLLLDFPTGQQVEAGLEVYNRYRNNFASFDDAPDFMRQVLEAVRRVMYGED